MLQLKLRCYGNLTINPVSSVILKLSVKQGNDLLQGQVTQQNPFPPRFITGEQLDPALGNMQLFGEELTTAFIRSAFNRWRGQLDLEQITLQTDDPVPAGTGLYLQREDHTVRNFL